MFGYSVSAGNGRLHAGENDQVFRPRTPRVGRYGVILLHGAGNPSEYIDPATQGASVRLAAALASVGIPCVSGAMGGDTWANDAAMTRIDEARALLAAQFPVSDPAKVALVGASMGAALAARYSQLYPSSVAAVVGLIPLLDLVAFYSDGIPGVDPTAIATAWGVTAPDALPAGANIAASAASAASVPFRAWYATNDPLISPSWVTNYAATVGGTATSVGALGHTDAAIGAVPISDVIQSLATNGC